METPYIWKNGKLINWNEALDHNIIHSLHYGSGVFEWIRFYSTSKWPKIFRLTDHIDRLFYSADCIGINIPFSKETIINWCIELVKKCNIESWYIRPIAYFWYCEMWLNPIWVPVEVVISVWNWWKYLPSSCVNVKISSIRRVDPQTVPMWAKICWNYVNSVLSSLEVKKQGYDEALLLDTQWFIAEWPWENIFFVKWSDIFTPIEWTILPGITRSTVIEFLEKDFNIKVKKLRIHPSELWNFDEAFFVWTAAEITPIWSITNECWKKFDYNSWKLWSLTDRIKNFYIDIIHWKNDSYKKYLI